MMSNSDCDEILMETTITDMSTIADMLQKQQTTDSSSITFPSIISKLSGQTLLESIQSM